MVKSACDTLLCIDMLNLIGRAQKMFQVPHNCKSCIPSLVTPPGSPRNPNRQDEMGFFSHTVRSGFLRLLSPLSQPLLAVPTAH